jgi:hypothetical protein
MTPKYQTDDSEFIGSLSFQQNIITRRSQFIIGTKKIENCDVVIIPGHLRVVVGIGGIINSLP